MFEEPGVVLVALVLVLRWLLLREGLVALVVCFLVLVDCLLVLGLGPYLFVLGSVHPRDAVRG